MAVSGLVLGGILMASGSPANAELQHFRDGGWDLRIEHDTFTGQTRCALGSVNRHFRYQPGAVGFRMGKHRDTLSAWYRIDEGAPARWQDRTASLIGAGAVIDGPALDNPTGGWVWIPVSEVETAKVVSIRVKDKASVRRYRIGGFAPMLYAARRLGCASDDAFRI